MKSELIKQIREKDKNLRDNFKGLPLFQVSFKDLVNVEDDSTLEWIDKWYDHIVSSAHYKNLIKLWRENKPEYWARVRGSNLPEYESLKYLREIFVADCKKTMPHEIVYTDPRRVHD